MGAPTENLRETHELGSKTREWLVSTPQAPGFGAPHQRVAGFTEARAGYRFVRRDPAFATVLITERGEGRVLLDGQWRPCPADHAYLMPAHSVGAYHIAPGKSWRLHWVIHFEPGLLPSLPPGGVPRLIPCEATGLRHAIEGLCREQASQAESAVIGLWGSLIDRLFQRMIDPAATDQRLARLWSKVHDNIGDPWDLPRLARTAGMSEENLRRLCVRDLGHPPMAHLTQMRMQAAMGLLLHSGEKLDSLAARLGYTDAFAFSTAFKRVLGSSPRGFRTKASA